MRTILARLGWWALGAATIIGIAVLGGWPHDWTHRSSVDQRYKIKVRVDTVWMGHQVPQDCVPIRQTAIRDMRNPRQAPGARRVRR